MALKSISEALDVVEKIRNKQAEKKSKEDKYIEKSNNIFQLPLWPENVRAVPNGFLRSALFGAIAKGKRRYMDREQIAAVEGIKILCTGQRLDQGDLDAYESILHAMRIHEMGKECRITSYALLKLMGKTDTGSSRETLHKRITRLRSHTIEIKQGRYVYIGGLIDEGYKDEETQEWIIVLNPKLRSLFEPDQFTNIAWSVRHTLDGKPLAKWLHSFYSSHAKPYPMRIDTLLELSGSENNSATSARQTLRKALDAVSEASKAYGESFTYNIEEDLVHVEKKPSKTQRKYLAKNGKKTS
jgi:TrfA protein